jgi:four helix bundle protein
MNKVELERRTKKFALLVVHTVEKKFRRTTTGRIVARQLIRSACSVASNYREANRAESLRDFAHKLGIVEKEAAETEFWLDFSIDVPLIAPEDVSPALNEARQLLKIFTSATRTLKKQLAAPEREDKPVT